MAIESKGIGAALLKLQETPIVSKAKGAGQVGTRKYKYATLEDVWTACRDRLNKNGLIVHQYTRFNADAGWFTMVTRIAHVESGQSQESELPILKAEDMQRLGSAITYARRYGLVNACGVIVEDDDGAAAVADTPTPTSQPTTNQAANQNGLGENSPPATDKQKKYIHVLLNQRQHDFGEVHTTGMTMAEAKKMIDQLLALPEVETDQRTGEE